MVRLIVFKSTVNQMFILIVSIPKMVRLIELRYILAENYGIGFNSKDGAIDRGKGSATTE